MSEEAKRPDPLQVALTAIGDFDRAFVKVHEELDLPELYQRAQLRVLFALAMEVRATRQELAKHTEYLDSHYRLHLEQYGLNREAHAIALKLTESQLAAMGV